MTDRSREIRKYKDMKLAGDILLGIGGTGFVGSVLSPFDFEGPIVEILTAILALIGLILKKVAENNIADLEGVNRKEWGQDDKRELEDIGKAIENTSRRRLENKKDKK